jgi:dipeptidyl aminopeptidase/acylaminoacyl peptidase
MMLKRTGVLLSFVASLATVHTEAQTRMDLDAFGRIVRMSDPQISPDGRTIALSVSRANFEENRFDADLVLVDVASSKMRTLTSGRRGLGQPRWSPSGDRMAFLALGPAVAGREPKSQVFILPMDGGDARKLTDAPNGVQHFAWSPDGASVAFATADEPEKLTGIERHNRSFEIGNDDFLVQAAPQPTHIWVIATDGGGAARRVTSGSWSLPTSFPPGPPASPLSWSPDGKSIAFTRVESPHSGDFDGARVHVADVASGAIRALTGKTNFEGHPVFSPDGSKISFWRPRGDDSNNVNEINVAPAAGGAGTSVTPTLDRHMARSIWMPDGASLLVGANDGTRVSLWVQPIGSAPRKIALGDVTPASSFWVDVNVGKDGAMAFVGSSTTRPAELYYLASANATPRRLTELNAPTAAMALGRSEVVEWQSEGYKHNGILTYPPDYQAGRKYPLVLVIHGGPRAASLENFGAQAQLFAARGWLIFQPNYRGSDQLGQAYQRAITGDAGAGPGRDVMAGLATVKARGIVDESRIGVTGWSYGGYMTSWLIGNYPNGWRAAMAGAPVTDNLDQYNLGDGNVRRRYAFGGSPWTSPERMKAFRDQSPITYASKIRTPTLILHNMGDYRVTVTQGFQLYHALKDNGVETKFVGYPLPGHNAADPVHQRDVQRRWMGWLADHFEKAPLSLGTPGGSKQNP